MAASKRGYSFLTNGGSKLVWKAYAITLRAHLTTQDDLNNSSKAIFVASPGLFDIPAGEFAPQEITNDHLFRRADVLQDTQSPFYMSDGDSYFDSRRKYLKSVYNDTIMQWDVSGQISKLRSEVQRAQERSAEAYIKDLDLYHKSEALRGPGLANFEAWAERFGVYHAWAQSEQKRLEWDYNVTATRSPSSVGLALAAFDLAQDTSTLRLGSNMPCCNMDIPSSVGGKKPSLMISPDMVYYRPLYSINGIERRIDSWVDSKEEGCERVRLDIDLARAKIAAWASLGFPNLDSNPLYDTSTATSDVKLSLEAGGMQAFDVDRGLWDVSAATRSQLGSFTSADSRSGRLMKITRILLGYNVKIRLTSPNDIGNPISNALLNTGEGGKDILGIPIDKLEKSDGQIVVASAPSGYPAVLAVLGREI